MDELKSLREHYDKGQLLESDLLEDPIQLFMIWIEAAIADETVLEPNMMVLSTCSEGKPSARAVLLKGLEPTGFIFYTNYHSRKAREILDNPNVSLTFNWLAMHRQVRIEGIAEKISKEKSSQYFQSRPKGSQIGAWASPQSTVIPDRSILEKAVVKFDEKFKGIDKLPKPPNWGGFLVQPQSIEFWQGRRSRLHDRLIYKKNELETGWKTTRLAP